MLAVRQVEINPQQTNSAAWTELFEVGRGAALTSALQCVI
jgi:hypothetical protein